MTKQKKLTLMISFAVIVALIFGYVSNFIFVNAVNQNTDSSKLTINQLMKKMQQKMKS